ncbi:MAG: hypothetical protein HN712_20325 [Gemmatimonadetes bacterium]|nr:hypothetical protein [Gemmatimonadota bacterium]MBT7862673.1 hypothetical protein [Gemmatimonadota bacterium]
MRVGIHKIDITPEEPVWLTGYADRDHKSEGVYAPLHGGAIYLEGGHDRALILTADVIGFSPPADAETRSALADVTGLLPRQIVLTATHTHCAPFFSPWIMPGREEPGYRAFLIAQLQKAALQAMATATAGRIGMSRGHSAFGVNRRRPDGEDGVLFAPHPEGPIDRDLDTLWLYGEADQLIGSLTVYGCHPTSLSGYDVGPDYPGFLCRRLAEQSGAPALFATGCAGDIRPWFGGRPADTFPRPDLEELIQGGESMADEAMLGRSEERTVDAEEMKIDHIVHRLPYDRRMTVEELRATAAGGDPWLKTWAQLMLEQRAHGEPADACPHEIQVLQLSPDLRAVFLGGEILSEIGLHIKQVLSPATTISVAYSNGLIAYVPSANAHPLGGYEVDGSHHYFRRPARFTAEAESLIVEQTQALVARLES